MSSAPNSSNDIASVMALLRDLFKAPETSVGAKVKFVYKEGGTVTIDGSNGPNVVHDRDEPADSVCKLHIQDHLKMLRGELNQAEAFRTGCMFLSGDVHSGARYSLLLEHVLKGERPEV